MSRGIAAFPRAQSVSAFTVEQNLERLSARLESNSTGYGASLIGVEDAGGLFAGTTVEEVLAEIVAGVADVNLEIAAATTLTIAAGVVTATRSYHAIDTEAAAGTDDLDTINGLVAGQFYVLKMLNAAHNVVLKHGTGNIKCPSGRDITLDVVNDKVFAFSDGTSLLILSMSLATPANGGLASAIGSTSASQGASLVGIQDVGSLITATTVEAALQELRTTSIVKPGTTLTVAGSAIALTQSYHLIETTGGGGSSDLTTVTGFVDGGLYFFRNATVGHDIVFKSGAATIICPGNFDITMTAAGDTVVGFGYGAYLICFPLALASLQGGGLGKQLFSSAPGQGASKVGIEDSLGLITATNVESSLAEIAKYEPILLADVANAAIPVTRSATINIVTSAAETNTLAVPTFIGQRMLLNCDTRAVGNRVITVASAINVVGNTIMTFSAAGQCIELKAVKIAGAFSWRVLGNDGVALS